MKYNALAALLILSGACSPPDTAPIEDNALNSMTPSEVVETKFYPSLPDLLSGELREWDQTGREHFLANVDLDSDGRDEAVIYVTENHYCGSGGCRMIIARREAPGWRVVTHMATVKLPIRLLETRSNGWSDLSVVVAGGGITEGFDARLRFDGSSYPRYSGVPPAIRMPDPSTGRILIDWPPSRRRHERR